MSTMPSLPTASSAVTSAVDGARAAAALTLVTIITILVAYQETLYEMAAIWRRSDTHTHGFFIFPISAYLVWRQRRQLASLPRRPMLVVVPVLAVLGFGWTLADLASVEVAKQYLLVAMLPVAVWAILGNRLAWALAFPLSYLLLAVPFGQAFIPGLIEFTADFTVWALQLSGIPVYREGHFFAIPSGNWSVVEACSGIRYLIASFTLGTLYAYLSYRQVKRRLVFVSMAIVVPILANGVRAYLIVMIGHLSGMRYAVGVDHLLYGWVFFGMVMLMLFWIGGFWREDMATPDTATLHRRNWQDHRPPALATARQMAAVAAVCSVVALIWPAYVAYLNGRPHAPDLVNVTLPEQVGPWAQGAIPGMDWRPSYTGAAVTSAQGYRHAGRQAFVHVAYYRNQKQGAELINYLNTLVPETEQTWRTVSQRTVRIDLDGQARQVTQNELASSSMRLLVWRWYWFPGGQTTNPYFIKAVLATNKLLGRGDDMAEIIVAVPFHAHQDDATLALREFVGTVSPQLTARLTDAQQH